MLNNISSPCGYDGSILKNVSTLMQTGKFVSDSVEDQTEQVN